MTGGHTVASFDTELTHLHATIVAMGRAVEDQFRRAMEAIVAGDTELASAVIQGDSAIDRQELDLEGRCLRMLALRQPMAGDLREVISALKIASNLERMGDFAGSVAKRAITLSALPVAPPVASLGWMGTTVQSMIADVVRAYETRDADLALAIRERDGEVDTAYTSLFREFLTYMMETPTQITGCTHLLFVAKSIERIGDHATNVAETVCFMVRGQLPSEERTKGDLSSYAVAGGDAEHPPTRD